VLSAVYAAGTCGDPRVIVTSFRARNLENLQLAAARFESGKTFDSSEVRLKPNTTTPTPRDSQSPSICQVFVKNAPDQPLSDDSEGASEIATNSQDDQGLVMWLGVRDDFRNWFVPNARDGQDVRQISVPAP
jgi:hypothetical protein